MGQILAAPERHRRDTVPGGWEAPTAEFSGRFDGGFSGGFGGVFESSGSVGHQTGGGFGGAFETTGSLAHVGGGFEGRTDYGGEDQGAQFYPIAPEQREFSFDEYGPPRIHDEYGPPPVPHDEYGPPTLRAEPVTEQ